MSMNISFINQSQRCSNKATLVGGRLQTINKMLRTCKNWNFQKRTDQLMGLKYRKTEIRKLWKMIDFLTKHFAYTFMGNVLTETALGPYKSKPRKGLNWKQHCEIKNDILSPLQKHRCKIKSGKSQLMSLASVPSVSLQERLSINTRILFN